MLHQSITDGKKGAQQFNFNKLTQGIYYGSDAKAMQNDKICCQSLKFIQKIQ